MGKSVQEVFSHNLRLLRRARGLTQVELAKALGVSAPAVQLWETGERFVSAAAVDRIVEYFDISVGTLFSDGVQVRRVSADQTQIRVIETAKIHALKVRKAADAFLRATEDYQ